MGKKHRQYTRPLDLVKLDEPNRNSMKAKEKATKLWNDVKGSPSDYQELIVKLEKRISLKKSRNAAVWKSFVKKTEKTTNLVPSASFRYKRKAKEKPWNTSNT